jgi:hypothetical protein
MEEEAKTDNDKKRRELNELDAFNRKSLETIIKD